MKDLFLQRPARPLFGRDDELDVLLSVLDPDGPLVVFVHGLGGMGKTTLLEAFARAAQEQGSAVVQLDCGQIEPTPRGFLEALPGAFPGGTPEPDLGHVVGKLADLGARVVLSLDTFEAFRLVDSWLRQDLVPALPANTRVVIAGRHPPNPAWQASPAPNTAIRTIPLHPLERTASLELLQHLGLGPDHAERVSRFVAGHPLLLQIAGAAVAERPWLDLAEAAIPEAIGTVTQLYLHDLDAVTRRATDAASVVRRVTEPLLAAMVPDQHSHRAQERLRELPFVRDTPQGLALHETLQTVIASALQASDPGTHRAYRRAAWEQLRKELRGAARSDAWRYTADMLYLIGNPVVREAFFPTRSQTHVVEPARPDDAEQIAAIVADHEPPAGAACLACWWTRLRTSFRVARDRDGSVVGFSCMLEHRQAQRSWLDDDPVAQAWMLHLAAHPVDDEEEVLLLPRWLTRESGELPDDVQAALWLDIKGAYTARRPHLRRLYTVVRDLRRWAPIVGPLGFRPISAEPVHLDGHPYHPVVLDFGPGSVDGWLTDLVAEEMGLHTGPAPDPQTHTVDLDGQIITLAPLEYGILDNLIRRNSRPATRIDLLREVWGTDYEGGSNVVAAVVRTLRQKLGDHADIVETLRGVGYRYRPH